MQEPYTLGINPKDFNKPTLEFTNIFNTSWNKNEFIGTLHAKKAMQINDKNLFYDVNASFKNENYNYLINANKAQLQDKILSLFDKVNAKRNDGLKLQGDLILYDLKNKTLESKNKFLLTKNEQKIQGNSFLYDLKNENIKATNIKALINMEKK